MLMQRRLHLLVAWIGLAALLVATVGCGSSPQVLILSPTNGTFSTAGTIAVQGIVLNVDLSDIADVQVNGVSVLPLTPGMAFNSVIALDPANPVHPIVAEVIGQSGTVLRDRITVIVGDSIPDGSFSDESIALRMTEAGLDELEPAITSLVPLDIATLVPPGTLIVDNFCYQDSIFGCLGRIDATISGNPPPSLSSFSVDLDPMTNFVAGDITLFDLFFRADVVAVTGIGFSCDIDVTASTTLIPGDYGLEPLAANNEEVDVTQLGNVSVSFGNFNDSTDCDGFLGFIVEFFIGLFISDLQNDFVRPGLEDFLNTVDGNGNTVTAAALETALETVELTGPIGDALGVDLEAPMFVILEDTGGVTLGSDARIISTMPDPAAVDLTKSFHVDQAFPTFGALAPNGQPYDLALCISASAFNQLLKAEIESGLLITSIADFDFGGGLTPITAGLLSTLLPQFAALDPAELLSIDLYPTIAPVLTGEAGPAGELATLMMPHLDVSIVPIVDPSTALLRVTADAEIGLDAGFSGGELVFTLSPVAPMDIDVTILENPLFVDEVTLDLLLPALISLAVPTLSDSLGSFPLPDFLGLQLGLVDVDRNGQFMSLYFDLSPAP
jgi:hypothetical protein